VGLIGPLRHRPYVPLDEFAGELVSLDRAYARLRLTKSDEELEWLRLGCELTDAAVRAIHEAAAPEVDERELGNMAERAYVGRGGTTHIHYFGATPMDNPDQSAPAQWPAARRLERGDALTCEVSASFWGYPGQLLRTFAVASEPSQLYRELHDAADAAFDAILARVRPGAAAPELVEVSAVIEESGFTTRDDLVHGFVGGYLPPVLGSASRQLAPVPDVTLEAGMTLVVQPNPITPDGRAGVQTGELVLVTPTGAERLHDFPRGLLRAPAS
jgi:Xaa-Pro aminopeptidase